MVSVREVKVSRLLEVSEGLRRPVGHSSRHPYLCGRRNGKDGVPCRVHGSNVERKARQHSVSPACSFLNQVNVESVLRLCVLFLPPTPPISSAGRSSFLTG